MYISKMKKVLDEIENNLSIECTNLDYAKIAGMSNTHFLDIFKFYTGFSVKNYIRKRILSESLKDLKRGEKVIDVALNYGYETPDAFTKAFKSEFNITPREYINEGIELNYHSKLSDEVIISKTDYINMYNFTISKRFKTNVKDSFKRITQWGIFDKASLDEVTHMCDIEINLENALNFFLAFFDIPLAKHFYDDHLWLFKDEKEELIVQLALRFIALLKDEKFIENSEYNKTYFTETELFNIIGIIQSYYDLETPKLIGDKYYFTLKGEIKEIINALNDAVKKSDN